jgi:hypothetical protein
LPLLLLVSCMRMRDVVVQWRPPWLWIDWSETPPGNPEAVDRWVWSGIVSIYLSVDALLVPLSRVVVVVIFRKGDQLRKEGEGR